MKAHIRNAGVRFAVLVSVGCLQGACGSKPPGPAGNQGTVTSSACAFPTTMAGSNEQTAWQLFVAANCMVNGKLTWETWTEQSCFLKPGSCGPKAAASTAVHRLHGSRLGEGLRRKIAASTASDPLAGDCSAMTNTDTKISELKPFVPKNLAPGAKFCEEVFVNSAEAAFVQAPAPGATLTTLTAQVSYAGATSGGIQFPTPAVEIKADWLPAAAVNNAFDCTTNPPAGVYVETIAGTCYALVGIHVSSKLLPSWLWATFEPQNSITNPNRCNPDLYNACNDPWGSSPATSTGSSTQATPALQALMEQAGIAKQFSNYRLVAAQSSYLDANNNAIQLGNSFVEFNASVLPHQASCMTCHSYALVTTKAVENPNFGAFPGDPPIGTPGSPPSSDTWLSQDFSWMLGIMP